MFKIPKQEYTVEFKELAVKRIRKGGVGPALSPRSRNGREEWPEYRDGGQGTGFG